MRLLVSLTPGKICYNDLETLNTDSNSSNSFFLIPVAHFPWSDKGRENRGTKKAEHTV